MPYRNAGIRITIDGEKELVSQIKRIQAEYKVLKKEVELVQAQYSSERNTLEALTKEYEALQKSAKKLAEEKTKLEKIGELYTNAIAQETAKSEQLKAKLDQEKEALDAIAKSSGTSSDAYLKQAEVVANAQKEYDKSIVTIERLTEKQAKNKGQIVDNEIAQGKLNGQIQKTKMYMDDAAKSTDHITKKLDEFGNEIDEDTLSIGNALKAITAVEGFDKVMQVIDTLKDKINECVEAYMSLEDATVSVTKTVNGLSDQEVMDFLQDLSLQIPLTVEQLGQIASQGGQYGIGRESLSEYTRVMAALQTSTNIGEDLSSVAQLAALLQVAESDYERMASTLVDLGNNTRTTEKNTVEMAQTIAASGKIIGLTEPEILGLAAAISATGGQARGAGSAMNRFMSDMHEAVLNGGEDLEGFAKVAGVSSQQFKTMFEQNAMDAIFAVLSGMHRVVDSGGNIYETLDMLGAKSIQEKQNLRNLALGYEDAASTISLANEAWKENTALAEESNKAWQTTSSQLQISENQTEAMAASVGKYYADINQNARNTINALGAAFMPGGDAYNFLFGWVFRLNGLDPSDTQGIMNKWNGISSNRQPGSEDPYAQMAKSYTEATNAVLTGESSFVSQYIETYNFLTDSLREETAEIRASLDGVFDAMDTFSEKGQITLKDFNKNLEGNTKKLQEWSDNYYTVMSDDRITGAFRDYLKELSPEEGYQIFKDLVGASDQMIADVSANFNSYQQSLDDTAVTVGVASGKVAQSTIEGLTGENMPSKFWAEGQMTVNGLVSALTDSTQLRRLSAAAARLGTVVRTSYANAQKIQSPSKEMYQLAVYDIEGLINAYRDKEGDLENASARLAVKSREAYSTSLARMSGELSATLNNETIDYTNILKRMDSKLGKNNVVVVDKGSRTSQSAVNDLERALVRGMLY